MQNLALKSWVIAIPVSVTAAAAMSFIQRRPVPGNIEVAVRTSVHALGLVAVPFLLALAFREWAKVSRPEMSTWRSGAALTSMVLLSGTWLFFTSLCILGIVRPGSTRFLNLEWMATLFSVTAFAALLAVALMGAARSQGTAAAVFMWAWLHAVIYH